MGNIGEDQDLTFRLNKTGYQFIYLKDSFVWHKLRNNYKNWAKNMFTYGKGRMWLIKKHPDMLNIFFIAPVFLILSFLYIPDLKFYYYLPLYYFVFIIIYSIFITGFFRIKIVMNVIMLFLITHLCYGLGEIYGLLTNRKADL